MHSEAAWAWFSEQQNHSFLFCRFTQLGLMRLLATSAIMGEDALSIGETWKVYDRWLEDPRIATRQEPFDFETAFRAATRRFLRSSSPKALGDCYLLAFGQATGATLVTFDRGLASACQKARQPVVLLATGATLN
jgi:predicted nucleic acid-binding protein